MEKKILLPENIELTEEVKTLYKDKDGKYYLTKEGAQEKLATHFKCKCGNGIREKLSEEARRKISESKKGRSIGAGKILSDKHKEAISNGMPRKLNDEQIKEISVYLSKGISCREISKLLNTSHTTISSYIKKYNL